MKQIIVIGCGRFGTSVAKTLTKLGYDVLVVDNDAETVKELSEYVTHAVQMDATDEASYKSIGIKNFDVAVIAIGSNVQASIMATVIAKEMGVPTVVAKAQNEIHGKVLGKVGADKVIYPERDMGVRIAYNLVTPNILDVIEFSSDYSIIEIVALDEWGGKTLRELKLSHTYGLTVIAIKTGDNINISPYADDVIKENDVVVILGDSDNLRRIKES
ncbi:trk system potassium uptake protein TrkA [Sedimentibacter acidaminivorans]|uniref:Trk system potassium uptake protein TrkA n=1 Tax=Sedimentibacter acidaminivorans TaxID=913099 RepID=A0ABS4G9G9_9FIRM|nr:TrkA family potassium uptake protein [Sedimentibacter acidaminivorans]MBP1924192.1 trk system potassium uptake protein TrkA [Sedimentibacter acidaminivorans]